MKLHVLDRLGRVSWINYDPKKSDLTDERGYSLLESSSYITERKYVHFIDPTLPIIKITPDNYHQLLTIPHEDFSFSLENSFDDEIEKNLLTNFLVEKMLNKELLKIPYVQKKLKATLNPLILQYKSNISWKDNLQMPIDLAFFISAVFVLTGKLVISIE